MVRNYRVLFFILLALWFLVNLIQASYTEVLSDEAYYCLYGKYLAWGYFDHPPVVALIIRISSLLFSGNLGIRFMTVVLQPLTLLLIWRIIDDPKPDSDKVYSFFIIAASICLFAAYGFYTTPDVPLLFFIALFLLAYKNFLEHQSWKNVLFLSFSMAGLVYSKYQAVLVIGFIVISNIKLLRSYKFWIAGIFALLLFIPHLWWQVVNDFPTFKFHLIERSEEFKWRYILEYLPNQMAVYNPVVLGAAIYIIVKNRSKDLFARALHYLIIGFILFFGVSALRGHVEPHWTISCSVAMIILLFNQSVTDPRMFRMTRRLLLPVVLIIFAGRILLVMNLPFGKYLGFNGKKELYKFIESVAEDRPVLFPGSYQGPSLYSFFTGKESTCVNTLFTRKTEFDIWQFEKKYNNKPVFICYDAEGTSRMYEKGGMKFFGYPTDSLQTVNRIEIKLSQLSGTFYSGDSLNLSVTFYNPYPFEINFSHRKFPVTICAAYLKHEEIKLFPIILRDPIGIMRSGERITRTLSSKVPELPADNYTFGICLQTALGPAINNSFSEIKLVSR